MAAFGSTTTTGSKEGMSANGEGKDDAADARIGMIQVNDLVYKLDTDLSVAINRTHKTQFFQNANYTNTQTAIAIVNSGADYVDPRRSFLMFDVVIPPTALGANIANEDYQNAFVSAYFGKNGSVLNLIDSVVVSSRSGDELSRVNDFGQLMNELIPEMFGPDWRDSIGQQIGFGSFLGGSNDSIAVAPAGKPPYRHTSEQRRTRFAIPLYLVSPIFNYGRLLPSMLMSGLRIEIKWKQPDVAFHQFWEGFWAEHPADGWGKDRLQYMDPDQTEFKTYLGTSSLAGLGALDNTMYPPATVTWSYTRSLNTIADTLEIKLAPSCDFNAIRPGTNCRDFEIGDSVVMSFDNTVADPDERYEIRFRVMDIKDATTLFVSTEWGGIDFKDVVPDGEVEGGAGGLIGAWRVSQRRPNGYQRAFGAPALHGKFLTPNTPILSYTINAPEIAMCCVQLTDAIQRTLNEFSSVNGLEIVYADYDRTSAPVLSTQTGIYTEVRKSASRALCAFARIVQSSPNAHTYDSFASAAGIFWNAYQWQLGSLYFPQQKVEGRNTVDALRWDAVLTAMYAYTQDAFDRYHPKAAPTMATMRGTGIDFNKIYLHPTEVHAEHSPSTYLAPYSAYGKWGSFVHGGTTVATTLERSSLFDLSGIPINNSRVLALIGDVDMTAAAAANPSLRAQLYIFLKYVRLARIFLVNCEVEQ